MKRFFASMGGILMIGLVVLGSKHARSADPQKDTPKDAPPAKNAPQELTIPQIVDVLNQQLETQGYLLIRRTGSFTIVRSDAKIEPSIVPRISIDQLKDHGETEVVSVIVQLRSLLADELVKEITNTRGISLMGPFGEAVAIGESNQLVLQ